MIKILCLDDEVEMADLLRLILEPMGYEILAATRSLEALEILHREPVDILIQDLMRPEIDGWQFFQMLKADSVLYTLPVMVLTAKPETSETALDIQLAGVDAYVTMPFGPQELLRALKDVLQQRNLPLPLPHRLSLEGNPKHPGLLQQVMNDEDEITPAVWRRLHTVLQADAVPVLLDALNAESLMIQAGAMLRVYDLLVEDARVTGRLMAMLDTEPASQQAAVVQKIAAQVLGELKVREAVEPLIGLLCSEYELVRCAAAYALREIGDARAVEPMVRVLYTEHVELYAPACGLLGDLAEASAVPALCRVLLQGHASVQHSAVTALVHIGNQEAKNALGDALQSEVDIARRTVWALGNIKGVGWVLDMLAQALAEGVPDVRRDAARALGNIGNLSGFVPLCAALQDAHHSVRRAAADALGNLGLPEALPYLIDALEDEHDGVSAAAAEALGKIGDARAIEALLAALSHPNSWTRWQVTRALGQLGEDITRLLSEALTSGSRYTRQALIGVLAELGHRTADGPLLPQIVTALIWALEDRRAPIRQAAVQALTTMEDPRIVPALLKTLRDEHGWVRRAAVRALHALGDARAVMPLVEVLRVNSAEVQMAAARALGDLGSVDVVDPLVDICIRADAETRLMAAIALTSLDVSDAVISRLDKVYGANPELRLTMVEALADTQNADFVPFLIQCLSSDVSQILILCVSRISATAARVLGYIGDTRAVAPLADILHAEESPDDTAWACAYALGQLGDMEGVPVLEVVAHGDARYSRYGWPVADAAHRALMWIQWSTLCL